MPTVRVQARHAVIDAVLLHLGACARCRSSLAADLSACRCGRSHVSARGSLSVFLPERFAMIVRRYAPRWRAGFLDTDFVAPLGDRATQLFCALAQCAECGHRSIAPETLQCTCGISYIDAPHRALMPDGSSWLLHAVAMEYGDHRRPRTHPPPIEGRALRRRVRRSKEIEAIYGLQHGKCYYCGAVLGPLAVKGAFHRDHLKPLGTHIRTERDYQAFENLALTCWSCNEEKGCRDELTYWELLRRRRGSAWLARRRRATSRVRRWREQRAAVLALEERGAWESHLDAIVNVEYEQRMAKRRARR